MRKHNWMATLYDYIVADYIKDKPEKAKDTMERILFLMQYDSILNDKKKPMLPYKIYIYEDEIRVRYISDLLRVTREMGKFFVGGRSAPSWRGINAEYKYLELSKKYKKLAPNQIALRVERIIANETLSSKYFVFEKYEDKNMRKLARLNVFHLERPILFFFWLILTIYALVPYLTIFLISIYAIVDNTVVDKVLEARNIPIIVFMIIITIPWLIWTRKLTKPTEYELQKQREAVGKKRNKEDYKKRS